MADISNITSKISQALGAGKSPIGLNDSGSDLGGMFGNILKNISDTQKTAETVQAQALQGKANVTDVVKAVNEAEIVLQTFTSIRDRFISAYQDIMRMPV